MEIGVQVCRSRVTSIEVRGSFRGSTPLSVEVNKSRRWFKTDRRHLDFRFTFCATLVIAQTSVAALVPDSVASKGHNVCIIKDKLSQASAVPIDNEATSAGDTNQTDLTIVEARMDIRNINFDAHRKVTYHEEAHHIWMVLRTRFSGQTMSSSTATMPYTSIRSSARSAHDDIASKSTTSSSSGGPCAVPAPAEWLSSFVARRLKASTSREGQSGWNKARTPGTPDSMTSGSAHHTRLDASISLGYLHLSRVRTSELLAGLQKAGTFRLCGMGWRGGEDKSLSGPRKKNVFLQQKKHRGGKFVFFLISAARSEQVVLGFERAWNGTFYYSTSNTSVD